MALEVPTYYTIIAQLSLKIDAIIKAYTYEGYHALSTQFKPAIDAVCILFIVITGYLSLLGKIQMSVRVFQTMVLKIGVVLLLALNWNFVSEHIVNLMVGGAEQIGNVLMAANPLPMPDIISGTGIYVGLQAVLIEVANVGSWVMAKGSWNNWGPYFNALMIYISGYLVVGFAFFEILIAKIMMAVLFCTTPFFVVFTLFKSTRSFFDRWFGTLVGFSFVLILVSSVVGLCVSLMNWTLAGHFATKAAKISLVGWMPITLVAGLCITAVLQVSSIAKGIGMSCASAGASAMVGGLVGGFLGASNSASRLARPFTKPAVNSAGKAFKHGVNGLSLISSKAGGAALGAGGRMMKSIQSRLKGAK